MTVKKAHETNSDPFSIPSARRLLPPRDRGQIPSHQVSHWPQIEPENKKDIILDLNL